MFNKFKNIRKQEKLFWYCDMIKSFIKTFMKRIEIQES